MPIFDFIERYLKKNSKSNTYYNLPQPPPRIDWNALVTRMPY